MNIYVGGRQFGKTWAMINWLLADSDNRSIWVISEREKVRIVGLLTTAGYFRDGERTRRNKAYWEGRVITVGQVATAGYQQKGEVMIDNADMWFNMMYGINIVGGTVSETKDISEVPFLPPEKK